VTLKLRTILGDVEAEQIGFMLHHEHLINKPPAERCDPDYWIDDVDKAIAEVRSYQQAGGTALAEMTGWGYGRNPAAVKRIATETGLHIVMTTGLIMESFFPPEARGLSLNQLTDIFVREISEGIDGMGICAGVIKCGTSQGKMTSAEETAIRAAARAQLVTGAAISTHTMGGTMALAQIDVLTSEGVDPARIIIGHIDRTSLQFGYFRLLASKGVYLGIDSIGKTKYYPDSLRVDVIRQLIMAGFVKQILLADDNGRQSYFTSYGGGPGLDYIPKVFVSLLRAGGVSEEDVRQMTVVNPRTALALGLD
jgi:5-phospho-D-xylono-1,4-lactonase